MSEQLYADPDVLTGHTDVICSISIERIVTGRNAALTQIETLIHKLVVTLHRFDEALCYFVTLRAPHRRVFRFKSHHPGELACFIRPVA